LASVSERPDNRMVEPKAPELAWRSDKWGGTLAAEVLVAK
jgi:hypothetical protein